MMRHSGRSLRRRDGAPPALRRFAGKRRSATALLAAVALAGCAHKGTLDPSQVQTVKVDGRLFEVRVAPTDIEGEYRVLVVRATLVIDPDPEREHRRNWNVAQPFMAQTCKGPYRILEDHLDDRVNLYIRFRCVA